MSRRELMCIAGLVGGGALLSACSAEGASSEASEASQDVQGASQSTYWVYSPAGEKENGGYVDSELKVSRDNGGFEKPSHAAESLLQVESVYSDDIDADVTKLFYQRGWTDGLPIVAPTEQRLIDMMKGTDLARDDLVATIAPLMGQATASKVAVNAIMAGCQPSYLPVLIAATQAVADNDYYLVGGSTTTGPCYTVVLVNGPIASQIQMNSGSNALGRGWQANSTIGRAMRLIEQNVGGSWPQISDISSLGWPGDNGSAFAEAEEDNPWQPYHVEEGFDEDDNVATVFSFESMQLVMDIDVDAEGFLDRVVYHLIGDEHLNIQFLLILTPATASKLAEAGFDKQSIRDYIDEHALVPASQADRSFSIRSRGSDDGEEAADVLSNLEADDNGMVKLPYIEHLSIVVAGGVGEKNELITLWSSPVSRLIDVPEDFEGLLQDGE